MEFFDVQFENDQNKSVKFRIIYMPKNSTSNASETRPTQLSNKQKLQNPILENLNWLFHYVFSIQLLNSLYWNWFSNRPATLVDFHVSPLQTNASFLLHFQRYHMFRSSVRLKLSFLTSPLRSFLSKTNSQCCQNKVSILHIPRIGVLYLKQQCVSISPAAIICTRYPRSLPWTVSSFLEQPKK